MSEEDTFAINGVFPREGECIFSSFECCVDLYASARNAFTSSGLPHNFSDLYVQVAKVLLDLFDAHVEGRVET